MRQTKEGTEQTRLALLDASEALFYEKGAANTSVNDIARSAGLTRGAFYHHFRDKAAVFQAIIERARAADPTLPDMSLTAEADPLALLRDFCTSVFDVFVQDQTQQRSFAIVMHRREALGDLEPLAKARRDEICRTTHSYQRLLEQAQNLGRLAPGWTPPVAAATLYSLMMGLLDQWLRRPERFDVHRVGLDCLNQLFDSFECRPAPPKG